MKKAILITMLAILYVLSCNNSSNAQTTVNNQNNNAVNNQNNSSNAMYNQELKKSPINIQTNANGRVKTRGFAAVSANMDFKYHEFTRHAVGSNDVLIEILYAGICHSDIHVVEGKSSNTPLVVGHEIAGRVVQVGNKVTKFKVGDFAGIGCMVNSCGQCESCLDNLEQYCLNRAVYTYGSRDRFHDNEITQGGYSDNIVVSEDFAILIPDNAELDKVAPLLCAGITTYSPLKFSGVKEGDIVGVAGFGGLGSMAVKYAVNMGAQVYVFARNDKKKKEAPKRTRMSNPLNNAGINHSTTGVNETTTRSQGDPLGDWDLSREMNNPRQATQNERGNDFQNVEKKDFDVFQADSDADDSNDDSLNTPPFLRRRRR